MLHRTTLHYNTLHYTMLCYATLCYNMLHYTMLQYAILHCTALYYTTLYYTVLHYVTLYYTTLHHATLHYTMLHYTMLYYTTLCYTTLHYATLHYTKLHYTTYIALNIDNTCHSERTAEVICRSVSWTYNYILLVQCWSDSLEYPTTSVITGRHWVAIGLTLVWSTLHRPYAGTLCENVITSHANLCPHWPNGGWLSAMCVHDQYLHQSNLPNPHRKM